MRTNSLSIFPFSFAAAVLLGGCLVAEPIYGSSVQFESYGDHLYVTDTAPDGHSAVGVILVNVSPNQWSSDLCWNSNGNGSTVNCNYNFAEGRAVQFYACIGEKLSKQLLNCGGAASGNTAN
jgi:hypothetical protein